MTVILMAILFCWVDPKLECNLFEYITFPGFENLNFAIGDRLMEFSSLLDNTMTPYAMSIGEKHTYFLSEHSKHFENNKTKE